VLTMPALTTPLPRTMQPSSTTKTAGKIKRP
jgi:hypothetical protein